MKPSLNKPAIRKRTPVRRISPAPNPTYVGVSSGCSAVTAENTSTAEAEVPATTSCLLVPKMA
jgi:hypothetical protein